MKVNLIVHESQKIVNYENVYINQLDTIIENSCFEILCLENVLKFVDYSQFHDFIKVLCSKLRHGGEIIISGIDIEMVIKNYDRKSMDFETMNNLLKQSAGFYNCKIVEEGLRQNRLNILDMFINDNIFTVKGGRD